MIFQSGKELFGRFARSRIWRSQLISVCCSVRDNPPSKDGLSVDDCERIIISLIVAGVFELNVVWGAYE